MYKQDVFDIKYSESYNFTADIFTKIVDKNKFDDICNRFIFNETH